MKVCPPRSAKAGDPLYECNPATGRWVLKKNKEKKVVATLAHAPPPAFLAPAPMDTPHAPTTACVPETGAKYLARKSPAYSAANCPVGMVKEGKDGRLYVVVANKNGIHRWAPSKEKTLPSKKVQKPVLLPPISVPLVSPVAHVPVPVVPLPQPSKPNSPDTVVLSLDKVEQKVQEMQHYDISKGVMKYKELRPRQVQENKHAMLQRYVDERYYASRKYDGWQAVWDGRGTLTTKTGKNTFPIPAFWRSMLPKGVPLAGELIIEGKQAANVASLKKKDCPDWAKARFMIFDIPTGSNVPFSTRYTKLQVLVKDMCLGVPDCPLRLVHQKKITSVDMLYELYRKVIDEKGEGLVLTKASSLYIPEKQSFQRVKLKGRNDAEGVIVGYHLNEKDPSLLKSLMLELKNGVVIRVGIGFSNVQRKHYKTLFPLGKLAKFSFREWTDGGQPKESRFIAIRQDLN